MVQLRSILTPADNSGAKRLMVIGISSKIGKKATIGDVVLCVVKGADSGGAVADHEKVKVLIVRTKKETRRKDGTYVRFSDNAAVIIDQAKVPRASRIFGPIASEIKDKGFSKIVSLAKEVV